VIRGQFDRRILDRHGIHLLRTVELSSLGGGAPQLLEPARAYPGALIVVEGIDGSGKSTQLYLLKRWLEIGGYRLHFTEWNSSPLVKSATRRGKQAPSADAHDVFSPARRGFRGSVRTPDTSLLHSGYLVLADRYIYTAFARDVARNCSHAGSEIYTDLRPFRTSPFIFALLWTSLSTAS